MSMQLNYILKTLKFTIISQFIYFILFSWSGRGALRAARSTGWEPLPYTIDGLALLLSSIASVMSRHHHHHRRRYAA